MSWYTIGENWIWFLIAALLAFLLGWLLHGILRRPKTVTNTEIYVLEKEIADLRLSKDGTSKARLAKLEAKLATLKASSSVTAPVAAVDGSDSKLIADLQGQLGKLRLENEANLKLIDDLKGGRVQLGDLKSGKIQVAAPALAAAVNAPKVVTDLQAKVDDLEAQLGALRAENDANLDLLGKLKDGKVQVGDLKSGKFSFGLPSLSLRGKGGKAGVDVDAPDVSVPSSSVEADAGLKAKLADLEARFDSLRAENDANLDLLGKLKSGKVSFADFKSGKFSFGLPSLSLRGKGGKAGVDVDAPDVSVSSSSVEADAGLKAKLADLETELGNLRAENDANLKLLGELKDGKVQVGDLKSGKFSFGLPSFSLPKLGGKAGIDADAHVKAPDVDVNATGPSGSVAPAALNADLHAELAKLRAENAANARLLGDLKGGKVSFDDFKAGKVAIVSPSVGGDGDTEAELEARLTALRAEKDADPGLIADLEARLMRLRSSSSGWLQAQLAKLRGKSTVDSEQVAALEAQLSGPSGADFDVAGELVSLRTKRASDQKLIAKLQREIAAANGNQRRKKTEAEVAEARTRVAAIAKRTAGEGEEAVQDDLEEIYGVGPIISEMLHSMGVTSFRQVARFDKDDIETVGDALEVFPDRITRDDWMSSARELHKKKYGADPLDGYRGESQIDETVV